MYRRTTHAFGAVPALSLVADGAVVERGKNEAGSCPCLVLLRLLLALLVVALLVVALVLLVLPLALPVLALPVPTLLVPALPVLALSVLALSVIALPMLALPVLLLPVLEVLRLFFGAKRCTSPSAALFLPFSAMPSAIFFLAGSRFSHDPNCFRVNAAAW
jgi:hypothetical protein